MNAYEVLGVEEGASAAEINKAYKEKILLYADRTDEEAAAKTEEINAAYDSLMYSGQTTFNSKKFDDLAKEIEYNFYEADVIVDKTICNSTEIRQKECEELSRQVEAMIVIALVMMHFRTNSPMKNHLKKNNLQ